MGEWKEYKLGEITIMKNGKKRPQSGCRYPVYGGNGIMDYSNSYNSENVIIIGRVGAYCGCVYKSNEKCWVSDNAIAVLAKDIVNTQYLYYLMNTLDLHHQHIGGAQPLMTQDIIKDFSVLIPSLQEQQKIASILSSLDDKIEVNRKICENLEQQAQALFKSWFVDFEPFKNGEFVESELGMIPKGWRVDRLGEMPITVTDYVANGSFASLKENVKLYEEVNYAYFIRNTDLKTKKFCVFVDEHSYKFLSKSKLEGGEIIISNVGDVGSVHLCPYLDKPMTLGNNIIMVKSDNEFYRNFLYILFRWNYGQKLIQSIKGGSAQPKFNKTDFKSLKIIVPKESVLKRFDEIVSPMFNCIGKKDKEIQGLASLRDTLLPKLMSGELKVNEL